ncbi:hypothetical protein TVAG_499490 [Trichomonas vaginalis G3]|uniref:Uncharacterized protein n=1 Tax=Trichomonas vaginalis (strain ATCC PRA-98 / G3) TaxID=412133 RepID=A2EIN6_TRIV3|nr:hypothetical protein TVAGG3_0960100 [Trichomonas vaginalis G3]EAY07463.1 hypothetical protein TVAG_499490 [Trichomonas vaginalis G3]KAI5487841.1 hypothetical protein TVAGG3_0960100 [Trichomonas vaginalis G3]|eukprot:XP_001319686.1 hypothetical protein [Trichomonas vaginalis G3]
MSTTSKKERYSNNLQYTPTKSGNKSFSSPVSQQKSLDQLEFQDAQDPLHDLEVKKYELQNKNMKLISELGAIGDTSILEKQLTILESISRKEKLPRIGAFLDTNELKSSGVLAQDESLSNLPSKVKQLHKEIDENITKTKTLNADLKSSILSQNSIYVSKDEDEKILEKIRTQLDSLKSAYTRNQKAQLESLKMEIYLLKTELQDLQNSEGN